MPSIVLKDMWVPPFTAGWCVRCSWSHADHVDTTQASSGTIFKRYLYFCRESSRSRMKYLDFTMRNFINWSLITDSSLDMFQWRNQWRSGTEEERGLNDMGRIDVKVCCGCDLPEPLLKPGFPRSCNISLSCFIHALLIYFMSHKIINSGCYKISACFAHV